MKSRAIRQLYVDYFVKHGHQHVASSGLIPENDPTLLFANAGMNQFKNLFLGLEKRKYSRAVTSQKCVRAGGKHNDLENVGFTARHHTFFEMLGNFSFGDYFKKDAIHFAWELLTKELQIPKDKLYVTVFENDDEAADIWHKQEGVPRERIYRFGEKDNFWRMGDTGPCGPCSEIFYDHGPEADLDPSKPSVMGGEGDRYVEIWNNVFMQFNEDGTGQKPLPKPSVDTGAGLERWAAMLQGKPNNYDTDLFLPIISKAAQISRRDYVTDYKVLARHAEARDITSAMRVVADHSRATAFLMADGVLPSNEGRGYVLRRIMRRAIRYARKLSDDPSLFVQTCAVVIDEMSDVYPELTRGRELVLTNVRDEVTRFLTTLDQGTHILEDAMKKLGSRGAKTLEGEVIFKLYDTFGFPMDLTRLMAQEKGFAIDESGFERKMEEARAKSAQGAKFRSSADAQHLVEFAQSVKSKSGATSFTGYDKTSGEARLLALSDGKQFVTELKAGQEGLAIFDATPFYAEGGGQVGDRGTLKSGSAAQAEIVDCTKQNEMHVHHLRVTQGSVSSGSTAKLEVTLSRRRATANNHSATHLLHAALRQVLGPHVTQAGSLVEPERLRFDFTNGKGLTRDEISRIEKLVNAEIAASREVSSKVMGHKDALAAGALALFGEKYGDEVRVIQMGAFSTELCGGTHVSNTSQIRLFKILSEGGVSAGVRRIEATTADRALDYLEAHATENMMARESAGLAAATPARDADVSVAQVLAGLREQVKDLEKEVRKLKGSAIDVDSLIASARPFAMAGKSGRAVMAALELDDRDVMAKLADQIRDKLGSAVVALVGQSASGKHPIIVSVSKDLVGPVNAGKLLGEIAREMGGKGGGRPDFAQGAGENLVQANAGFAKAAALLQG